MADKLKYDAHVAQQLCDEAYGLLVQAYDKMQAAEALFEREQDRGFRQAAVDVSDAYALAAKSALKVAQARR